ncbi:Uma2 family endonuclease [Polyangium aurulentum]|uniref:Uma2 family endonuclease n=1 Tax=Polyangium aurulentum TaxID=2567896 RepID=UPI0010AE7037|nr:Uma2 family endonuclease [Polyangium aurulentum]UQA59636.1 Uma2 family endonuclease [Polyangium aurulentum]
MSNAAWQLEENDPDDPTFYPSTDDMGEDTIQRLITELLRPLLERYLAAHGIQAFVGADQFIYWEKGNPRATVAPDVYVMPGLPQDLVPRCWKVWRTGVAPSFALEVMSEEDDGKDLEDSPRRYEALGVKEVIVFDPYVNVASGRMRFRVHRRNEQGRLVLVQTTNADRVHSEVLGCFLRAVGQDATLRLRIAVGPAGDELFPTEAEEERAKAREERKAFKAEQEAREAERKARQAERKAREAAEAEIAKLRAEIEQLRARSR